MCRVPLCIGLCQSRLPHHLPLGIIDGLVLEPQAERQRPAAAHLDTVVLNSAHYHLGTHILYLLYMPRDVDVIEESAVVT